VTSLAPHPDLSRNRLLATIEATSDFVGISDADGNIEFLNLAGRRLLGLEDDVDLSTVRAMDFQPPETLALLRSEGFPVAMQDGSWSAECEILTLQHVRIPVSVVMVAHRTSPGEVPIFSAIIRDLRERTRTVEALRASEAALRRSDRRFRAAIDGSLDAVLALAAVRDDRGAIIDFDIVDANPRAAKMVRMPQEDLIGHRICELFPLDRSSGHFDRWVEVIDSKVAIEWEFESIDPRVVAKWIRCQAVPLDDGVALSLRDVTAEKIAESELRLLLDVARDVAAATDLDTALGDLLWHVCEATQWQYGEAWVLETLPSDGQSPEQQLVRRATWSEQSTGGVVAFADATLDRICGVTDDLVGRAWGNHRTAVARTVFELSENPVTRAAAAGAGIATGVAIPVLVSTRRVAVLAFYARDAKAIDRRRLELLDAVSGQVGAIIEQRALEARLAALSEPDEVTQLPNRRGFRRMAEQELKSSRRAGRRGAVLYIDLDDLKPINDTHGHAAGDQALRATADVLRSCLRESDLIGRLGGDEFAVFATGLATLHDTNMLLSRLYRRLVEENAHHATLGRPFEVGFSIGLALVNPGDDLDTLLARADKALYVQKAARKGLERVR